LNLNKKTASSFNQDLSVWCVTNINSEPIKFTSLNSAWATANFPVWSTRLDASLRVNNEDVTNILIKPNLVLDRLFIKGLSDSSKVSIYKILGKLVVTKTTSNEIDR